MSHCDLFGTVACKASDFDEETGEPGEMALKRFKFEIRQTERDLVIWENQQYVQRAPFSPFEARQMNAFRRWSRPVLSRCPDSRQRSRRSPDGNPRWPSCRGHRRRTGNREEPRPTARLGGSQSGGSTTSGARPRAASPGPAQLVVDEIVSAGGEAVANTEDVTSWEGGRALIDQAVEHFGGLDAVVNNAGVVRDKPIVTMTEDDWDLVVKVAPEGPFRADALGSRLLAGPVQVRCAGGPGALSTRRPTPGSSAIPGRGTTAPPRPESPRSASCAPKSWNATASSRTAWRHPLGPR